MTHYTRSDKVVQLYINNPVASVAQPVKKMVGFQKITLKKGESREGSFTITEEELKYYNNDLKRIVEPGEFHVFISTSSSEVKKASFNLQ